MDQEEHLAKVDAEIDILSHENQDYQTRLQGLQVKISQKKQEISDMERQMNSFENEKRVKIFFFFLNQQCFESALSVKAE